MINKKLLLLSFGLLMTTQMIFSQVPSYVPTNGLVGYWPFNGNANDQSGNGNNGTVTGASLTTDRFGNNDSAYNFDGINDYIQINNIVGNFGLSDFTISIWYNTQNLNWSHLINKRFNESCGNFWEFRKEGFEISQDIGCTQNISILNTQNIQLNNWYNVTIQRNGNVLKYYIDGTLSQTITTSIILNINNDNNVIIGAVIAPISGLLQAHNGKIDDIGIWNRALSQQEITNIYNGVNYSDTCNAVSGSLTNGLVGYWPFCGNANDQSGNGNNGVVNGTTLTTDRFGNSNSAYDFDGVTNYISLPSGSNTSLNITSDFTASFWLKTTDNSGLLISTGDCVFINSGGFTSGINAGNVGLGIFGASTKGNPWNGTTISVSDNNWHNIVYTLSGGKMTYYIDNILNSQFLGYDSPLPWEGNRIIGKRNDLYFDSGTTYSGLIDDIGIWNRALSQEEIAQLFNQNQCITNITVTDTLIINVGQLSYTNPVTYANNITIYPNPANTQVNISFNNITDLTGGNINIINSLGQQVATTPITLSGTNTTMPLNSWGGTGLYFVQILNAQGIVVDVKKIILQ